MNQVDLKQIIRKPQRVRHSYTQTINAAPAEVFPLLCPVKEIEWVEGWMPDWIISESGLVEQGCVFQTTGDSSQADRTATWVVTYHDAAGRQLEMLKIISEHTFMTLQAKVAPGNHNDSELTITYEWTALGHEGEAFLEERTTHWYLAFMRGWKDTIEQFLGARAIN